MKTMVSDAALEAFCYVMLVGLMQALLTSALLAVGSPLLLRGWRRYRAFARRLVLLSVLLFAWGCAGDVLFVIAFRDRIYVNGDPFADFVPWLPSVDFIVDIVCGGHPINGATWNTLRLAWASIAVPVWVATIWSYVALSRAFDLNPTATDHHVAA